MSILEQYRVIGPGHTHAGKPLQVGDTVTIAPQTAARYPHIFQRVEPAKPVRTIRSTQSTPEE